MGYKHSFYLFAEPSFIEGITRIIDLGGTLQVYNESDTDNQADFIALSKDWGAIGNDIKVSIDKYNYERAPYSSVCQ